MANLTFLTIQAKNIFMITLTAKYLLLQIININIQIYQ